MCNIHTISCQIRPEQAKLYLSLFVCGLSLNMLMVLSAKTHKHYPCNLAPQTQQVKSTDRKNSMQMLLALLADEESSASQHR